MRLAIKKLATLDRVRVTIPPKEFDPMAPTRLRQGCMVLSGSQDSDLFMSIAGFYTGTLFFFSSETFLIPITWRLKADKMAKTFDVPMQDITRDEATFMQYEAAYLQAALAGPHDYNHRRKSNGTIYNSTGMTAPSVLSLIKCIGKSFKPTAIRGDVVKMYRQVVQAIAVAAEAARAEITRQNKCNLTPAHLESSFLAFWNQPMALASGAQITSTDLSYAECTSRCSTVSLGYCTYSISKLLHKRAYL